MSSSAALREIDSIETPACPPRPDQPNFDRLARLYRWMEWLSFGPFLWKCRSAFLSELGTARRALVLGDGDGRFTAALLRRNPQVVADAVDLSPAMLRSLTHRAAAASSRLHTQLADLRDWAPAASARYDLVFTHFFLDCLATAEVLALAERIRPALAPHARWVVSEFSIPSGPFGRWIARPIVDFLYRAFALLTGLRIRRLPDHASALGRAGFRPHQQRSFLHGLLIAQSWACTPDSSTHPSAETDVNIADAAT